MQPGFLVVADGTNLEFRIFGSSAHSRPALVRYCKEGGCEVVFMGRLDYRDDLVSRLGDSIIDAPSADPASLVLAAYRREGQAGIERLEGDFAVVVYDQTRQRLIASRDPMGGFPIYWFHDGTKFAFGTWLRAMVDFLPGLSLDFDYLGELLMLPGTEIDYFGGTVVEGIRRLVPGSLISVDLSRAMATRHQYWNWSQHVTDPGTDRPEEIAERYGELLRGAVRERLHGRVASRLIGEFGSKSLALLARNELSAADAPRELHAFFLDDDAFANVEAIHTNELLNEPGIALHHVEAEGILDFDVFQDIPLHDEPYAGLFHAGREVALIRAAAHAGADTLLTDCGANEKLANNPLHLADLLKHCRIGSAWRETWRGTREHSCSAWRYLGLYGLAPLMPSWFHVGWRAAYRSGYGDWSRQNAWTIAPWVLSRFARRGCLQRRASDNLHALYRSSESVVRSEALSRIRYATGDWARYNPAVSNGILTARPFLDPRVLSFGLGLGDRMTLARQPAFAEAMRSVLPEMGRNRPSRTLCDSAWVSGLARNRKYLEAMVRESSVDELELFDKDRLIECLNRASQGDVRINGTNGLNRTLAIIKWLSLLPRWKAQCVEPTHVIRSPGTAGETTAAAESKLSPVGAPHAKWFR